MAPGSSFDFFSSFSTFLVSQEALRNTKKTSHQKWIDVFEPEETELADFRDNYSFTTMIHDETLILLQ